MPSKKAEKDVKVSVQVITEDVSEDSGAVSVLNVKIVLERLRTLSRQPLKGKK